MSGYRSANVQDSGTVPEMRFTPTAQQLFLYAASTWNAHRIHYDYSYATQTEHYEGVVIQGPLIADFFSQHVMNWLGEKGSLIQFDYSNRAISYLGESLTARSTYIVDTLDLSLLRITGNMQNAKGDIVLQASATVRLF